MLVLTRKRDETIVIGDVRVTAVSIGNENVRLSITAPTQIKIHRKEVYEAVRRNNQTAEDVAPERAEIITVSDVDGNSAPHSVRCARLVLTRRRYETIMIGDDVAVTVVEIEQNAWGNKVRLGIAAPREIPVHRLEVFEAIMRAKQS